MKRIDKIREIVLKKIRHILLFFLVLVFVAIGIIYYVSTSNDSQIAEHISQYAQEQLGVELGFSSFQTSHTKRFPFVAFEMNNIYINGPHYESYNKQLLKIGKISLDIDPWDLIWGKYNFRNLLLKDVEVKIYKDSLGFANTELFPKRNNKARTSSSTAKEQSEHLRGILNWDKITFENVGFDFTDDFAHKAYKVKFEEAVLTATKLADRVFLHWDATCDFGGLFFKMEKGGFLENQKARLVLNVESTNDTVFIDDSQLYAQSEVLQISGSISKESPHHLQLNINSDAVMLENAKALLNTNLRRVISMFAVDQPLDVQFELNGILKPHNRPKIHVHFEALNTNLRFKDVIHLSNANFEGRFQNNYKTPPGESIQPEDASLLVDYLNGNIFGRHRAQIDGIFHDIKNLTDVEAHAKINADLVRLDSLLPNGIKLNEGQAILDLNYRGNVKTITKGSKWSDQQVDGSVLLQDIGAQIDNFEFKNLNGQLLLEKEQVQLNKLMVHLLDAPTEINGVVRNMLPFVLTQKGKVYPNLAIVIDSLKVDDFLSINNETNNSQKTTQAFNDRLVEALQSIAQKVEADLKVSINNLTYKNQFTHNTSFNINLLQKRRQGDTIIVISNLRSELLDAVNLNGGLVLKNWRGPAISTNLRINGDAAKLATFFLNETVHIESGDFNMAAQGEVELNHLNDINRLLQKAVYNSTIEFENINAQLLKSELPIKQLCGKIFITPDSVILDNTHVDIIGTTANIEGHLDNYLSLILKNYPTTYADLKIAIPTIHYDEITLPASGQTNQSTFNPKLFLKSLQPVLEKMDGRIELNIPKAILPKYPIEELHVIALMKRSCLTDHNIPCISLEKLHARIDETPIDAVVQLYNILQKPGISFELDSDMPIGELSQLIENDDFLPRKGHVKLNLNYENEIRDKINVQNYLLDADFKGLLTVENASLYYSNRGLAFEALDGVLDFDNKHLYFDFPKMEINGNKVTVDGKIEDYLPFFFKEDSDFDIAVNLYSPYFDFEKFQTPRAIEEEKLQAAPAPDTTHQVYNFIDRLLNEATLRAGLDIGKVSYRNFKADDVIGRAHIDAYNLELDSISMNMAGGTFKVHGEINDIAIHQPKLNVDLHLFNIKASEVFKSFENFGQDIMTHNNLKGLLRSDIDFSAEMDDDYKIVPESMKGKLQVEIRDGEFINFVGLKELTGFLFKNRHMDDIYFDKLETTLLLDSLDIKFNHFDLNSTAATLGVDGIYTFSKEDKTHLLLEVPIGNLFRPYLDKEIVSEHLKTRKGNPILVEAIEVDKKIKFKIKLFSHEKAMETLKEEKKN